MPKKWRYQLSTRNLLTPLYEHTHGSKIYTQTKMVDSILPPPHRRAGSRESLGTHDGAVLKMRTREDKPERIKHY